MIYDGNCLDWWKIETNCAFLITLEVNDADGVGVASLFLRHVEELLMVIKRGHVMELNRCSGCAL